MTWKSIPGISDEDVYYQLQLLSLHGQSKDALAKTRLGSWEYDIVGTWYKCNMTDIAAAIGLRQLDRYPDLLQERRLINETYDASFRKIGIEIWPHYGEDYTSTGHLYLTRIPEVDDLKRREIINKMADYGIACNVHYKPLHMHTAYRKLGYDTNNFPNSTARYINEITLPNHTLLEKDDVEYVIEKYTLALKNYLK